MKKIQEPQALNDVLQFHQLFNAYIGDKPHIPEKKISKFRVDLLQEELHELHQAIKDNDLVEIVDALADIQYVLSGAIISFGCHTMFSEIFSEVQRSNMSKACKTLDEAEKTVEHYKNNKDTQGYIQQQGDKFLVYRSSDNKVLKSINYSPANLAPIISKYKDNE